MRQFDKVVVNKYKEIVKQFGVIKCEFDDNFKCTSLTRSGNCVVTHKDIEFGLYSYRMGYMKGQIDFIEGFDDAK